MPQGGKRKFNEQTVGFSVNISQSLADKFREQCSKAEPPYSPTVLIRWLITAWIEGRVEVRPYNIEQIEGRMKR